MDTPTSVTNSASLQISHFILMGLPGIHGWQHWLSLPLAPLYFLALGANLLIMITIQHEATLHVPMYHFLGILAVVDMGLATTIMPKILATFWFDAKAISLPQCFAQIYAIHCFFFMESGIFLCMALDRYIVELTRSNIKALGTCSSHLILILFFYTGITVLSVTYLAEKNTPLIPVLLNVLHNVIPPALNPMVYALRMQELRLGFQRLLGLSEDMSTK
uniref:Olfactory receptor family 56 subfamily B member 4 n=1 Tax=Panthera tigris altaica TaxID=74533 RepID=A0A8C9K931_PANTA